MTVVNPRILDASIHDVCERLAPEQKAEILIHAMNLLKLAQYVLCIPLPPSQDLSHPPPPPYLASTHITLSKMASYHAFKLHP